jgi:thiol-disulfide isomerase/thioredoxin
MLSSLLLVTLLAAPSPSPAETRVVEYLKANVRPGQPVVVSELVSTVFTTPDERAALSRLFDTFFKVPLFLAQHRTARKRPPTLAEIAEQFAFRVPGQADVVLRIMESDPRMPRFFTRDAKGEITAIDVPAILAHPKFGKSVERSLAGFEGQPAPEFRAMTYDGREISSETLRGRPHVRYFWFTGCPPCVSTSPILARLQRALGPKGLETVALNADRVLEIPTSDAERETSAKQMPFTMAHMTTATQEAHGSVSVFPTLFFVNRKGVVVDHLVGGQDEVALEAAMRATLE